MNSQRKGSSKAITPMPAYRWVMLTLSWLLYFSFGLIYTTLSVLVTPVMDSLSLTYSQMGVILGSWQLVYIFFAQPAGLLVDRIGPYKSLFLGAAVISLSAALRWFATSFETLLTFVALFGIGGPMISIGLPKLTSMWFLGEDRGTASGLYTTGPTIGGMVASSITNSVVMPMVGDWKNVFLTYSLIGLLIAALWLFMGRRLPGPNESRATAESVVEGSWAVMRGLFKSRNVWLIVVIGITFFLTSHGLSNWLPKILELKGMTPQEAGFAVSFLNLFGILGSILIPRLPYAVRSKRLAISVTLFVLGVTVLVLGAANGPTIWVAMMLTGITMRGLFPLLTVTLMDMPEVGPKRMGMVGGLYFSIGEIGGFGGPFVMGVLRDVTGSFFSGIIFMVAVSMASIVLAALLKVDAPRKRSLDEPS